LFLRDRRCRLLHRNISRPRAGIFHTNGRHLESRGRNRQQPGRKNAVHGRIGRLYPNIFPRKICSCHATTMVEWNYPVETGISRLRNQVCMVSREAVKPPQPGRSRAATAEQAANHGRHAIHPLRRYNLQEKRRFYFIKNRSAGATDHPGPPSVVMHSN